MPVRYQQVIVERVLRQLRTWGGAFLVASTGLGKTVMATHTALRLKRAGEILNVMVFAPKQMRPDWERALKRAGISHEIFTRDLLDQPATTKRGQVARMLAAMEEIDDKYIIFIDESQRFRNRINATGDRTRYSFERLADIVGRKQPKVLLLTATPYAKGVEDLNNQLFLLPHTSPRNTIQDDGQMVLDPFADAIMDTTTWRVRDTEGFFEEFMILPVATVISTSQVAKNFATQTAEGEYIDFGEQRKWLPQIEVRKVKVPLPLEPQMTHALDTGYFKHEMLAYKSRIGFQRTESTVEQNAVVAWMSSPLALRDVLENTIKGTYQVTFTHDQRSRERALGPILANLERFTYANDAKLLALCQFLEHFQALNQKVILFTERLATAVYLEKALSALLPTLRTANVVQETTTGDYALKDFDTEVYDLILDFAPEANRDKTGDRRPQTTYDVLITTDAYSAGINLQDASVVVSYDIAWTPETIIQRAGRILRFWTKPRQVSLYIFVADFQEDVVRRKESDLVEARLKRLVRRARHAEKFSELPLIPDGERAQYDTLGSLTQVTIEEWGFIDPTEMEEFSGVSPFLVHIAELSQSGDYAQTIPDDIMSALAYQGKRHRLYLLLRHEGVFVWTLYDIEQQQLVDLKEDTLLELIRCAPDEVPAGVDPDWIEQYAQEAKALWSKQKKILHPESVERICALYLLPATEGHDLFLRKVSAQT